jgi:hypothetical protein
MAATGIRVGGGSTNWLGPSLHLALAAVLDLQGAEAEAVAAALLVTVHLRGQAHPPRGRERDLGLDVAFEMPAGAILAEIVHRRADARCIGPSAEAQRVFGAVRLHLRPSFLREA